MDSLIGITTKDWLKLLIENRFTIDPPYWHKALQLTLRSVRNSIIARREKKNYQQKLAELELKEHPIFIIGHWRSGTTLLHTLFVLNKNYATPNLFEVSNPHTFLTLEDMIINYLQKIPAEKRPMDNISVKFNSPGEDEFALSLMSFRSPIVAWTFPRHEDFYDRYLTFENVQERDLKQWEAALVLFIKKLTLRYNRQIVLKSPVHTGRIKHLLRVFPRARFIHIHRNPYIVFQSTQKLIKTAVSLSYLQRPYKERIDAGIIRRYAMMYEAFFKDRALVPKNQFIEICFEELEQDFLGQFEKIYSQLELPGFETFKPALEEHLKSISNYKKNKYPQLPDSTRQKIAAAWKRNFEEWGYKI